MKYEDIIKTEKYQSLLKEIPEEERNAVEEAIKKMAKDFEDQVILPMKQFLKQ